MGFGHLSNVQIALVAISFKSFFPVFFGFAALCREKGENNLKLHVGDF